MFGSAVALPGRKGHSVGQKRAGGHIMDSLKKEVLERAGGGVVDPIYHVKKNLNMLKPGD